MTDERLRNLVNIVMCTLAEVGEAPEGILYAGLMHADINLADYERIKAVLVGMGLATVEPGPVLKASARLLSLYSRALADRKARRARSDVGIPGGAGHGQLP